MPFVARSFYSDEKGGLAYYTYITKDLPAIMEELFHISDKAEDRFIGGNSMGGYGAIKIALREKGRYAAAFGLSSVANIHNPRFKDITERVFGGEVPADHDLQKLIDAHEKDEVKPRLYMTVGKEDFMYQDNIDFDKFMQGKDYDYTFVETEGNHSWDLWDITVQSALEWTLAK